MPNLKWSKLTSHQLGKYAEYYAKMEFASYGFEVYTTEVDDHGVDFVAKKTDGVFREIQVKSRQEGKPHVIIDKSKMDAEDRNRFVCVLIFREDNLPDVYLIPSTVWLEPNDAFSDYDYEDKSVWRLALTKKSQAILDGYRIEKYIDRL